MGWHSWAREVTTTSRACRCRISWRASPGPCSPKGKSIGPPYWPVTLQPVWPADDAWRKPGLEIAYAIPTSQTSDYDEFMISCQVRQVRWRTMRWHNGRTWRSPNPNSKEVFPDWQRIPSRPGVNQLQQKPYTFAQANLSLHFSLATRRRAIHSESPVTRAQSCGMSLVH
jgi:hypothetical protein